MLDSESVVLITGAGGAIGRHMVQHYAGSAGTIVLTGRDESKLNAAAQAAKGSATLLVKASDLRDMASLRDLNAFVDAQCGRLDLLIHNAADVTSKPYLETSLEEMDSLVRTNVTAPLQLTRLVMPLLEAGTGKTVVFVSSLAGYKANPAQTVYSISKTGLNAAAEALRHDLGKKNVHCMTLALSSVCTDGTPSPGQVPVAQVLQRLDKAIAAREDEVFLSSLSKYLMRAYAAIPALKWAR